MREIISLNFDWYFQINFKEDHLVNYTNLDNFEKIDLPHNMLDLEFNYFNSSYNKLISTYKKEIEFSEIPEGKVIYIVFEGVAHSSSIFLNDSFIMKHQGGYDEFLVDITKFVQLGKNILTVVVDNHEDQDIPPFGNQVDYLGYGGIYREVHLEILSNEHIKRCFLKNYDINNNLIICDCLLSSNKGALRIKVFDKNQEVYHNDFPINLIHDTYVIELKEKKLWQLNDPYMYNVRIEFVLDNIVKDHMNLKFGFRKITFAKEGFYLNNEKIKLRGLNRHQSYPYVGYAMPKSVQEKDADILKYDLGVNIVRTSHYMQSRHFLNRCDEIGLLVMEEIPGWQYIGNSEFKNNTLNNVKTMIERDFNHPSIVLWGVRINESPDDDDLYKQTNQIAHELDDTRPTGGVRNFKNSKLFEDVYTFNDFTHDGGKEILQKADNVKKDVPYLVTENNGHMYPTKRYDDEPHRIEHALRHYRIMKEASKSSRISGTISWCMNDYNTHDDFGSGDKICYHGVLDMFRIEKYASYIYSSQSSQKPIMEVLSTLNSGDYPASRFDKVYIASNVDYIKLYKNDTYIGCFYPEKDCNLEHPLFIIDDWIGDLLEIQDGFSKKDSILAKKVFIAVGKHGTNLPLKYQLMMLKLMKTYHLKVADAINLYYKYIGGINSYRFEGYINHKLVKTVMKEKVISTKYLMEIDKEELFIDNTYDATRIVLKKVDQNGNLLAYANDAFTISCEGNLRLLGPHMNALSAGAMAFWVRTDGKNGQSRQNEQGKIIVNFNSYTITKTIKIRRGTQK